MQSTVPGLAHNQLTVQNDWLAKARPACTGTASKQDWRQDMPRSAGRLPPGPCRRVEQLTAGPPPVRLARLCGDQARTRARARQQARKRVAELG